MRTVFSNNASGMPVMLVKCKTVINHPPNHHTWMVYTIKYGCYMIALPTLYQYIMIALLYQKYINIYI